MSANKEGKKPIYKDYVSFLEGYKNGKKEETNCDSLTNSSNNSSTSINSDGLNEQPTKGFKKYLENYENRKFSSVKPTFLKNTVQSENKKTVKTEIFININNDQKAMNNSSTVTAKSNGVKSSNGVNKTTRIFEKNSNSATITKIASSKVNRYDSQQSETETDGTEQKKISVEEISKKFQMNGGTLKKQNSIKEKTKLFENNANQGTTNQSTVRLVKQNSFKENSEAYQNHAGTTKPRASLPPKPPVIKIEIAQKITQNGVESAKNDKMSPSYISKKNVTDDIISKSVSSPVSATSNNIPPPPPIPNINGTTSPGNFPMPPSFCTNKNSDMNGGSITLDSMSKSSSLSRTPSPPPVKTTLANGGPSIPIPPPPPPSDFSTKVTSSYSPTKSSNASGNNSNKQKVTGYSTLPRMQSKPNDGIDGIAVPTLDKNDPRVKRLVYGALRDMYGAYHDQANDYLATLPKNRVRKNNGLDSIINSIA